MSADGKLQEAREITSDKGVPGEDKEAAVVGVVSLQVLLQHLQPIQLRRPLTANRRCIPVRNSLLSVLGEDSER